jgi:hypothetical protein
VYEVRAADFRRLRRACGAGAARRAADGALPVPGEGRPVLGSKAVQGLDISPLRAWRTAARTGAGTASPGR